MFTVYECLTAHHDIWLVLLAAAVCAFGSWVSLALVRCAAATTGRARQAWTAAGAVALGGGIWATHFIAMLAYRTGTTAAYDVTLTALSIVLAIAGCAAGIVTAIGGGVTAAASGGFLIGVATGVMHYTGMAALRVPDDVLYDGRYVVASVVIGATVGAAALTIALPARSIRRRAAGAMLLALGICGLHFTGMAAVALAPNPALILPQRILSPEWVALAVAAVAVLIMGLSLGSAVLDQRLAERARQDAQRQRASEERFRQLADATSEGILIHRDGFILDVNRAIGELLGRPSEWFIGRSLLELVAQDHRAEVGRRVDQALFPWLEADVVDAADTPIVVKIRGQSITHDGEPARVLAIRDMRERKQAEDRIRHMATHDLLTGLPNRALFRDRMTIAMTSAAGSGQGVAVFNLGLDRFKAVNDLLGHQGGDRLLHEVGRRLSGCVREQDTVARLGGDEFVVLQAPISGPAEAMSLAVTLVRTLSAPFEIDGQTIAIGASIGIAVFPQDGQEADQLFLNADTTLDRAKAEGGGMFRFFEPSLDERLQARRRLERDLRLDLGTDAMSLHHQPVIEAVTGRLVAFEALLRWRHIEHGMVPPSEFIPLAEECGLIRPLGDWVLRRACRDALSWPDDLRVAVNLSPAQFRQVDIAGSILAILADEGLPPHRLEIEVTEGVLIHDTDRAMATLDALKAAGVRIALDDFGTGYSSLSYLQKFTFDKLKIDRSFVMNLAESRESRSIVRAILALARSLRLTVTAEGVETEEQRRLLREDGCDLLQGYLIGRPTPADELSRYFASVPAQ